jgi:feruloyl esterase
MSFGIGATRIVTIAAFLAILSAPCRASEVCENLANLRLPATTIKLAQSVPAGDFTTPDHGKHSAMPAFCRVVASVQTAPDSDIGVEIWLPLDGWNGGFHGNGSGGYGGTFRIGYFGMEIGLKRGYATATTDMGTAPADDVNGDPLIGHPQNGRIGVSFRPM